MSRYQVAINEPIAAGEMRREDLTGIENYTHLGVFSSDISRAIAVEMQADAGSFMLGKAIGAGMGLIFGPKGAGAGFMLAGMAQDAWMWYKHMKDSGNPEVFWSNFKSNLEEAKAENSGIDDWMEGFSTGSSWIGGAARATKKLEVEGGQIEAPMYTPVGAMPVQNTAHNLGNIFGFIAKDLAATMIGVPSAASAAEGATTGVKYLIGFGALYEAGQKATYELGMSNSLINAMKLGALYGVASGATGATFMKLLPAAIKYGSTKWLNMDIGTSMQQMSPLVNHGADVAKFATEFAAWGTMEQYLRDIADGKDAYISPKHFGASFALGAGLSLAGKTPGAAKWVKKFFSKEPNLGEEMTDAAAEAIIKDVSRAPKETVQPLTDTVTELMETGFKTTSKPVKGDGRFMTDILNKQEIANMADQLRKKGMLYGFDGIADGSEAKKMLSQYSDKAYNEANIANLYEEMGILMPNIENKIDIDDIVREYAVAHEKATKQRYGELSLAHDTIPVPEAEKAVLSMENNAGIISTK